MVNACRMSVFEYLQISVGLRIDAIKAAICSGINVCIGVRFFMNARR